MNYNQAVREVYEQSNKDLQKVEVVVGTELRVFERGKDFDEAYEDFPDPYVFGLILLMEGTMVVCIREGVPFIAYYGKGGIRSEGRDTN